MEIISTLVLLVVITIIFYTWTRTKRGRNLPPGPPSIPILGNVQINWKDQLTDFRKLRRQYGEIFSLQLGSKTVVVINGIESIKELMMKHADIVSERPESFMFTDICHNGGSLWKEHRIFALTTLRDFGFGKRSLEGKILEEVEYFLANVKQHEGKTFDIKETLQISIANVICSVAFGHKYEHGDKNFLGLMKSIQENLSNANIAGLLTFFPFLRYIPGDPIGYHRVMENYHKVLGHMDSIVEEIRKKYDENVCSNYVDAYIKRQREEATNKMSTFTDEQMNYSVADIFVAGIETTVVTISWFILFMLHHPEIQERMRKEIRDVVGESRLPSLLDRDKLSFCDAVLHETLRVGNVLPLAVPHGLTEDLDFHGYTIPKQSMIFPCIDSILNDPDSFENPAEFNPKRFLAQDGSLKDTEKVLVFGIGRRACLGEALARMELFLFIMSLIQRFQLLPPDGEQLPPYTKGSLALNRKPLDFTFRAVEYS